MKKAIILALAIAMVSCKKEEAEPNNGNNNNNSCTCGIITDDGYEVATDCYWLDIKNECSDNIKRFCFTQDVWMNNFVGNRFCVYNVNPW